MFEPQVAHDGADDGSLDLAGGLTRSRQNVKKLIPVHTTPQFIDHHNPVAVAVERHAHLGPYAGNGELQQFLKM